MEFINEIFNNYQTFFSLNAFKTAVFDPASWGVIGTLIILEGLLSADNALVLAVMVKHLPKRQRKKALFYGIFGAYFFRLLVIGIGVSLIKIAWIKIVCGHYLLLIVLQNFIRKNDDENEFQNTKMGFWKTVLTVELMDISFSFDSVLAAFGVSSKEWVLFIGGILGILMMRGVANLFLALIEKVPEFETTAEIVFFSIIITVFLGTFVVHLFRKNSGDERIT
jgi:YkoY family integral membrane protein